MAVQPEILYRNILRVAQEGRGDGTIYAWATGASVDQENKTFTLSGLSIMADLGADADGKFKGYVLYFPASERSYLITGWTAATNVATVFEWPNTADTGTCEIRKALFTDDFDTSYPLRYAADGRLASRWKDGAAGNAAIISFALPNGVDDGGFESGNLSDHWTANVGGTGEISLNASSPMLGAYDCKMHRGDQYSVSLVQAGKIPLERGKQYGVIFKAYRTGTSNLHVFLRYLLTAKEVPVTWTLINPEDSVSGNSWKPSVGESGAWMSAIFTLDDDLDLGEWRLYLLEYSTGDVYVDEVYLFEVIQPDTLVLAAHNAAGGFQATSYLAGYSCAPDRSSIATEDYDLTLIDLDADITVPGKATLYETFTAPTTIYPIYVIRIAAVTGKTWEAGEIWIGERWTWPKFITGQWVPDDGRIDVAAVTTIGGVTRVSERYRKQRRGGQLARLSQAEAAQWRAFLDEVGLDKPFWWRFPGISALGISSEVLLMRNMSEPRPATPNLRFSVSYEFEEM